MAVKFVTGMFEPRVGESFSATPTYSGEPLELELASCDESPHARPDHPAFALIFKASDSERREQQIFTMRHDELGEFDLFLVPVGPTEYQAVIN